MVPLVTNPFYSFGFPHSHRFPMEKFALLADDLMSRGYLSSANTYRPGRIKQQLLGLAHDQGYLDRFINNTQTKQELRRMGLPWSEGLLKRTLISPNGTLLAASLALKFGVACHLAGGTHHAHRDFASGFCIFNDLAIAALALIHAGKVKRVLIFDCDVHQGDGTAAVLADEPNVITCSLHCEKNFPVRKAQSDYDVGLPAAQTDDDYLEQVDKTLAMLLKHYQPDLVIYDAGVDVYEHDPLGLLNITAAGIEQREQLVLAQCKQHGVPVATVIGGGYDDDRVALAKRHALVVEQAFSVYGVAPEKEVP